MLADKRLDGGYLICRQEFGPDPFDADVFADALGCCPVVAGQHHRMFDASFAQSFDGGRCLGTDGIRNALLTFDIKFTPSLTRPRP
jgi:hypothetical protein